MHSAVLSELWTFITLRRETEPLRMDENLFHISFTYDMNRIDNRGQLDTAPGFGIYTLLCLLPALTQFKG